MSSRMIRIGNRLTFLTRPAFIKNETILLPRKAYKDKAGMIELISALP